MLQGSGCVPVPGDGRLGHRRSMLTAAATTTLSEAQHVNTLMQQHSVVRYRIRLHHQLNDARSTAAMPYLVCPHLNAVPGQDTVMTSGSASRTADS
jgi:hypothetical protein